VPFLSSFSTQVQRSFEHLHILLANCGWVKRYSKSLCVEEEELFKGTKGLLLFLASLIPIDRNCLKFQCVPFLPPTTLVVGFWQLLLLVLLLVVREKMMLQHWFDAWEQTN
jgi:hypothetical protein